MDIEFKEFAYTVDDLLESYKQLKTEKDNFYLGARGDDDDDDNIKGFTRKLAPSDIYTLSSCINVQSRNPTLEYIEAT